MQAGPNAGSPEPAARILIVEDDEASAALLRDVLTQHGHRVTVAADGAQATTMLAQVQPDLILLDVILPDVDGLVLCAELRSRWRGPIILVTGTQRHRDRTLGLRLGADDFIAKPFDLYELVARVEAALRGAQARAIESTPLRVGGLVLNRTYPMAEVEGQPLPLTPTEFRLLAALARRPNEVVSRDELAQAAWSVAHIGRSRAVDVHVLRLRKKLARAGEGMLRIATIRGRGYKLVVSTSSSGP